MTRFVLVLLVVVGCGGTQPARASIPACPRSPETPPAPKRPVAVDDVAKELVARFNAHDAEGVFALLGPNMAKAFPLEKQRSFIESILAEKGRLLDVEREGDRSHGEYVLRAERGEWRFVVDVDSEGRIVGMSVKDMVPTEPPVAKSSIAIGLPFKGEWFVFSGGDTRDVNPHVGHGSQRRATDLEKVDASGSSHRDDGKKNEDYFAYGEEILSVADGTVSLVVDGVHDNEPGVLNRTHVPGNSVTVKHADELYSFYAHLRAGKTRVKVGQKVKRGEVIGIVGNSGNSGEPHLHFQLQDGPRFEASWGVEAIFANVNVTRDGKTTKSPSYAFLRGDRIAP